MQMVPSSLLEPCCCTAAILWGASCSALLHRRSNASGLHTSIHQRPLLHLCHLLIMDHNGSITNTQRNRISLIQLRVINSAASPLMAVNVCVCVMSFITHVQLGRPGSQPQFSASPQSELMRLPSADSQEKWVTFAAASQRANGVSPNSPRDRTHGHELSKHTTWSDVRGSRYSSHTSPRFCKYVNVTENL